MSYQSSLASYFLFALTAAICPLLLSDFWPSVHIYERETWLISSSSQCKFLLLLRRLHFLIWHSLREIRNCKCATHVTGWALGHKGSQTLTLTLKTGPSFETGPQPHWSVSSPEQIFTSLSSICKCLLISDIAHVLCLGGQDQLFWTIQHFCLLSNWAVIQATPTVDCDLCLC